MASCTKCLRQLNAGCLHPGETGGGCRDIFPAVLQNRLSIGVTEMSVQSSLNVSVHSA